MSREEALRKLDRLRRRLQDLLEDEHNDDWQEIRNLLRAIERELRDL